MKQESFLESKNPRISFLHFFLRTLIGSNHKNASFELALKIIAEIQVIAMLLHFPYQIISNQYTDSFGKFFKELSGYLSFCNTFEFDTKSILNDFLWIVMTVYLVILVLLVTILLLSYQMRKPTNIFVLKAWKNISILHYNLFFLLINQYILTLINYHSNSSKFMLLYSEMSLPFVIVGAIQWVISLSFSFIFCKFSNEPLRTSYVIAKRTTFPDLLILLYKTIDPPLERFIDDQTDIKWARLVLMVLILTWRLKNFLTDAPYFHHSSMKLFLSFSFIELAIALGNIVLAILGVAYVTQGFIIVYLQIILIIFFAKIAGIILESKIRVYVSKEIDTIKHIGEFHWKLFSWDYVISQGAVVTKTQKRVRDNGAEYLFYGILIYHNKYCKKENCSCHILMKNTDLNNTHVHFREKEVFQNFKFELLRGLYREGTKKLPFSVEIKIGLANIIFENKSKSYAPSISLIHTLNLSDQPLFTRVVTIMLLEKIENKLINDYESLVNVKEIIDYQADSQKMRKSIESNITKFLEFWELYKTSDPAVVKLYEISVGVNKEADEISKLWDKITRDFPKLSLTDHLLYGLYQSLVRSAPYSADKTLHKYFSFVKTFDPHKNRESDITQENVHEANNILVSIAMKREKLGIVQLITSNVEDILQYKVSDVVDKDVNILMPTFFQERHKRILYAHLENSRTTIFNRNRQVFTQNKEGYALPFTIYVTMFPYFQSQLLYIGILRPIQTFDDFILVLSDGTIDCFTENIGKSLGLNPQFNRRYNLLDISKELAKLHRSLLSYAPSNGKMKPSFSSKKGVSKDHLSIESSYSIGAQTMRPDGKDDSRSQKDKEDEQEEPMIGKSTSRMNSSDLTKTYELFTTTGITISFTKVGLRSFIDTEYRKVEYNTIILEENILGSHLRIFRLQTTPTNEVKVTQGQEEKSINTNREGIELSPGLKKNPSACLEEPSFIEVHVPADGGIKMATEDELFFKNPFAKKGNAFVTTTLNQEIGDNHLVNPKTSKTPELTPDVTSDQSKILENNINSRYTPSRLDVLSPLTTNNFHEKKDNAAPMSTRKHQTTDEEESFQGKAEKGGKIEKTQLRKFLKDNKMLVGQNADDAVDRNSVTSQARNDKINAKLERAIYLNEIDNVLKILTIIMILFPLISIILVIGYLLLTNLHLEQIKTNIDVLELIYKRSNQIIDINRDARLIDLLERGLAPLTRHSNDDITSNQIFLFDSATKLLRYNTNLRNIIYKIDLNEQTEFYEGVTIKERDDVNKIRRINGFDLSTEIATSAFEIYNLLPNKPSANNSDIAYILNNSIRDLLVKTQSIATLLRIQNNSSIQAIQDNIILVLIIRIIGSILIFSLFVQYELKFLRLKARFLEAFLTIKDHEIDQALFIVNNFHTCLKENRKEDYFIEKVAYRKASLQRKDSVHKKLQSRAFKAKKAVLKGINTPTIGNLFFISICLGTFAGLLGILLKIFAISREQIDHSRLRVIDAQIIFFRLDLVFTSLYEYIVDNGETSMYNNPIGQEWEAEYSLLSITNNYLATFIEPGKEYNDEVEYLLRGDLCSDLFMNTTCYSQSSGIASKGLLAIDGFLLKSMRGVKDFYDSSERNTKAKYEAFVRKDLIDAETIFEMFVKKIYEQFDLVLRKQFNTEIDFFQNINTLFVCVSVFICITLNKFLFTIVRRRMLNERRNYKNIMRIVPITVIINNRFLKNYLMTHSKNILDSVKNKL